MGNNPPVRSKLTRTITNGVIVPHQNMPLPEGTVVEFEQMSMEFTPEERAEFEEWEEVSAEAFQMIIQLEKEEGVRYEQ